MLERAADSGYEKDDHIWAKLTQIRKDGKLNFTMKECDQDSGVDLNPERTEKLMREAYGDELVETGEIDRMGNKIKVPRSEVKSSGQRFVGGIKLDFKEAEKTGIGALTGINLDTSESKHGVDKKTIDADALWLKSRIQGGGVKDLVDDPGLNQI